jgi:hypothetical protein
MMITDARFDRQQVQEGNLNPPGRRHGKLVSPEREARSELVAAAGLDGIYGQRWKCETVHSAIKRKFGDVVRSRQASAPRHDPAVKGSVYNAHVPWLIFAIAVFAAELSPFPNLFGAGPS